MQKQSFTQTFLFLLQFVLILLMLNILLSCNKKQKNNIDEDDDTPPQSYLLSDYQQKTYSAMLNKDSLRIQEINSPLLIVHLFDHTENIAQTQIDMLIKIEKQFKPSIIIKHITVDNASNPENITFLKQLQKHLSIKESNQLPLMVLYKNNQYYTHFEGTIPIEMVRHSIQKILKK